MGKLKNTKYEMLFLIFYSFIFGGLTFFSLNGDHMLQQIKMALI